MDIESLKKTFFVRAKRLTIFGIDLDSRRNSGTTVLVEPERPEFPPVSENYLAQVPMTRPDKTPVWLPRFLDKEKYDQQWFECI